jgi:sec-independent protein translocase protein TatB
MFDFQWSEIALIGVVALVLIGPKDMPVAIKAISDTIKKLRRMAGEFQHHVDDMVKEADLGDLKASINEVRSLNIKGQVRKALDPDGSLQKAFKDPFIEHKVPPVMTVRDQPIPMAGPPAPAPAFIPPNAAASPASEQVAEAPAFIPPASAHAKQEGF